MSGSVDTSSHKKSCDDEEYINPNKENVSPMFVSGSPSLK